MIVRRGFTELENLLAGKKKNKFGAIKVKVNGNTCDSKLEAGHYEKLLQCEKQGEIKDLLFHPRFNALVNRTKIGVVELDFQFYDNAFKKIRYVDSKGVYTRESKWKHKHIQAQYGIEIEIWRKK